MAENGSPVVDTGNLIDFYTPVDSPANFANPSHAITELPPQDITPDSPATLDNFGNLVLAHGRPDNQEYSLEEPDEATIQVQPDHYRQTLYTKLNRLYILNATASHQQGYRTTLQVNLFSVSQLLQSQDQCSQISKNITYQFTMVSIFLILHSKFSTLLHITTSHLYFKYLHIIIGRHCNQLYRISHRLCINRFTHVTIADRPKRFCIYIHAV